MSDRKLDETDRKILSVISRYGDIRYSELADKVGVSRNTAYRRVSSLKDKGIIQKDFIKNTNVDVHKFDEIGVSTIVLAMKFDIENLEKASDFLRNRDEIKLLFETYGNYDFISILFGKKGDERDIISQLREDLKKEEIKLNDFDVYSASLKKMDLTLPF